MKVAIVSVLLLSVWLCHATDTTQKALNPTPQQEGGADAADASLPPLQQNTQQQAVNSAKDAVISKPEEKNDKDNKDKPVDREEKDEGDDQKDKDEKKVKKDTYWLHHSPCPMLNSLAASKGMPRTGLTPEILAQYLQDHLGADKTFATKFATAAHAKFLKLVQKIKPDATTVALRQLTASVEEGGIEHLASLSRVDTDYSIKPHEKGFRHTPRPDAARVDHELSLVNKKGQELISMDNVKTIRKWVQEQTPNLPLKHKLIGSVEICLLRGVLSGGDPVHRDMRADWYRSFLVDEKFPEDYKVPTTKWGFGFVIKCVLSLSAREAASDIRAFFTNHLQHIPYLNGFTVSEMVALHMT